MVHLLYVISSLELESVRQSTYTASWNGLSTKAENKSELSKTQAQIPLPQQSKPFQSADRDAEAIASISAFATIERQPDCMSAHESMLKALRPWSIEDSIRGFF
jgi:hypothetical protein